MVITKPRINPFLLDLDFHSTDSIIWFVSINDFLITQSWRRSFHLLDHAGSGSWLCYRAWRTRGRWSVACCSSINQQPSFQGWRLSCGRAEDEDGCCHQGRPPPRRSTGEPRTQRRRRRRREPRTEAEEEEEQRKERGEDMVSQVGS